MANSTAKDQLMRARHFGDIRLSEANKLYVYHILRESVGLGTQVRAQEVEEALLADNILPVDLGASTIDEAIERLGELFKVTTFKKGRYFVTLLVNEEFEAALQKAEAQESVVEEKKPQVGARAWKQKKKGELKPIKPRPNKSARKYLALKDVKDALDNAYALLETSFEPKETHEISLVAEDLRSKTLEALADDLEALEEKELLGLSDKAESDLLKYLAERAEALHAKALSEYKDTEVEDACEPDAETEIAPVEAVVEAKAEEHVEPEAEPEAESEPETEVEAEPEPTPEIEPETEVADEDSPDTETSLEDAPTDELLESESHSIQFTITYDPTDEEPASQAKAETNSLDIAPGVSAYALPRRLAKDLPEDIRKYVLVNNELLAYLTQIAPFEADVLGILDEDFKHAISSCELSGNRNRVLFPLRFMHEGKPLVATLRRIFKPQTDKTWRLAKVDGFKDSTPSVGIDGLATRYSSGIADLLNKPQRAKDFSSELYLTTFAKWGDLTHVLSDLAKLADHEDWNHGFEADSTHDFALLLDYLATTLATVLAQGKLLVSESGFCAMNTGLTTSFDAPIFACFESKEDWKNFIGFTTPDSGALADRLMFELRELPERASYAAPFEAELISGTPKLTIDTSRIQNQLEELLPGQDISSELINSEVETAISKLLYAPTQLAKAQDPLDARMLWLAPITISGQNLALVLVPDTNQLFAQSVTTLQQARAFARITTRLVPQWLAN